MTCIYDFTPQGIIANYEAGNITNYDFLVLKTAIAWTIIEHPNALLEQRYSILLKYIIEHKELNELDNIL